MTTAQQGILDADHERSPLLNGRSYDADIGITVTHSGRTDGIATVDDGSGVNRETRDKVAFVFAAVSRNPISTHVVLPAKSFCQLGLLVRPLTKFGTRNISGADDAV